MSNLQEHFQAAIVPIKVIRAHPSNLGRELGDLRDLSASIREHGIRVPVILEKYRGGYRLRDGHRRVAAAQQAGIARVPAIIHAEPLDDEREWLLEAIDYNLNRQGYTDDDLRLIAGQLLELGVPRAGVASAFGVSARKLGDILSGPKEDPAPAAPLAPARGPQGRPPRGTGPRSIIGRGALRSRILTWQDEGTSRDEILEELALMVDDVDDAVVERRLAGDRVPANPAERIEIARRWQAQGGSLNELDKLQGWNIHRDLRELRVAL